MDKTVSRMIKNGRVGIIPTDTIYGLVGSAFSPKTVENIYRLKKRNRKKPLIVLIGSRSDLKLFGVKADPSMHKIIKKLWPGPVSIIFDCPNEKFSYLHRGSGKIAFRLPRDAKLRNFLRRTGPLVAPSANLETKKPAQDMKQAQKYFGSSVDFYVDGGEIGSLASALVEIRNGKVRVLRKGDVKIG